MANPIAKLVAVEDRIDGVYLKITQEDKARVRLDDLIAVLDKEETLNYDRSRISEVHARAQGVFEKIGPLFEFYYPELEDHVQLIVTPEKATLYVLPTAAAAGVRITERQLSHLLKKKGIVHGLQNGQIKRICIESLVKVPVDVALCTRAVPGENARLEFLVAISPDARPQAREDGRVDYREIRSFVSTAAGQVIAKKKPATPGTPGVSVAGNPIPATPGQDIMMPAGRNTEISADGTTLIAAKAGIIYQDGNVISIMEQLDIKGDVDFSIGNIKYSGDVLIHGNVLPGFVVEAEGVITIKGEVESARINSRNGEVHIERGIIGKGDTVISAKKGVTIAFAQDTMITTEGTLTVEKYLLNCDVTCLSLQSKDNHVSIMGGQARAEKSIQTGHLGSDKGIKTKAVLFDRERKQLEDKLKELNELAKKLTAEIEPIERQLKAKSALLKKIQGVPPERALAEIKKWIDAYNGINTKIKYVHQKTDEMRELIEKTRLKNHDGFIRINGNVFPGTELELYDRYFVVSAVMTNKCFKINKMDIEYG